MSGDVAVYEPRAGVIGLECDDDEAILREKYDVSTGRVIKLKVKVGYIKILSLRLL